MSKVYRRTNHPGLNSPDLMKGPSMYTCASRVKMPQIGADETDLTSRTPVMISMDRPVLMPPSLPKAVSDGYIKTISSDLCFDESVVKDRCFHTLPYDEKYFKEALDISDIVPQPPKARYTMARHNNRGPDKRHAPCHLQKRSTHKLKPMKRKILDKALEMHKQALEEKAKKEQLDMNSSYQSNVADTAFFLTETTVPPSATHTARSPFSQLEMASSNNWDEYLLSILSDDTSHWIASHQSDPYYNQDRLKTFLKERHGWVDVRAELIKDSASEADFPVGQATERDATDASKKWRRPDETMLDRVREATQTQGRPTDPYDDDTNAAFYRLPAGFRQAKKAQDKEEDAACNSTAFNIEVRRFEAPPPPTIRDFVNPKIGKTMYETANTFEQEWLTGGQQTYQKYEPKDRIFMNGNKYKKVFQKESPRKPDQWFPLSSREAELKEQQKKSTKLVEKGLFRWKALPEPVDESATNETSNVGQDHMIGSQNNDENTQRFLKTKTTLTKVVHDWRSKWHLDMRYADASPEDLIRDMADIHPHIRLKAITTCARASEYKPPPEQGIALESQPEKVDYIKLLPENLFIALVCCLEDQHERVALAAAIALYTLERPNEKAEVILRKALTQQGGSVDRWAAAQCLAYYGECDSEVVGELVFQLLEAEDPIRHQQAAELLSHLSENSTLVHSMLAEQLNSSSWRHRVMSCMVIPKLQGNINKDLVHKLAHLMWHDWHKEVRKACAQTLGKTGHGKDVHDELLDKMKNGNEKTRVEAVSKVGHLGIMTAKLLPVFLQCFHDEYVSVRIEACIACSNLKIKDEKVLEKLVFVATYDAIWKVKALAIQAMGSTGASTKAARECILWAFRFEGEAGVRAEACQAIIKLHMKDAEVVSILQDRFLVEGSDTVREKLAEALEMFGISPSEDLDMVAQIKGEVRKLCTKSKIALQITVNEMEDEQRENKERMLYIPPEEAKKEKEQRYRPFSQLSHMSSAHGSRKLVSSMHDAARPAYSRESSVVDREIQEIFEKAKRGRLTPETLSQYTESRPATSVSGRSKKAEGVSGGEEDEDPDEAPVSASQAQQIAELKPDSEQPPLESTPIDGKMIAGDKEESPETDQPTDGNQKVSKEETMAPSASPIKPVVDQSLQDTATTPKAGTEATYMDGETHLHDLSDSFTLPGSLQETQSHVSQLDNMSQTATAAETEGESKSGTGGGGGSLQSGLSEQVATSSRQQSGTGGGGSLQSGLSEQAGASSRQQSGGETGQSMGNTPPTSTSFRDAASVKSLVREPSDLGSILEEPEFKKVN